MILQPSRSLLDANISTAEVASGEVDFLGVVIWTVGHEVCPEARFAGWAWFDEGEAVVGHGGGFAKEVHIVGWEGLHGVGELN